jgi:hypothetical protein
VRLIQINVQVGLRESRWGGRATKGAQWPPFLRNAIANYARPAIAPLPLNTDEHSKFSGTSKSVGPLRVMAAKPQVNTNPTICGSAHVERAGNAVVAQPPLSSVTVSVPATLSLLSPELGHANKRRRISKHRGLVKSLRVWNSATFIRRGDPRADPRRRLGVFRRGFRPLGRQWCGCSRKRSSTGAPGRVH